MDIMGTFLFLFAKIILTVVITFILSCFLEHLQKKFSVSNLQRICEIAKVAKVTNLFVATARARVATMLSF